MVIGLLIAGMVVSGRCAVFRLFLDSFLSFFFRTFHRAIVYEINKMVELFHRIFKLLKFVDLTNKLYWWNIQGYLLSPKSTIFIEPYKFVTHHSSATLMLNVRLYGQSPWPSSCSLTLKIFSVEYSRRRRRRKKSNSILISNVKKLIKHFIIFFFHSFNSHSCTLTRTRPVKFAKRIAQSATVGPFHNDRVPFLINTLDFFLPRPRICLIFSLELLKFFNGAPPNGLLNRDDISPASKTNYPRVFFFLADVGLLLLFLISAGWAVFAGPWHNL